MNRPAVNRAAGIKPPAEDFLSAESALLLYGHMSAFARRLSPSASRSQIEMATWASEMAPAISTPVEPPPTIAKVRRREPG
jgi:hypothetical protein